MQLQESGEMYLETIYVLSRTAKTVRSLDVAEHMGYSKPSISRAIGLLKQASLVNVNADGALSLTAEGEKIARKIYERHTLLTEFLKEIGVSEKTAVQDACKMEHIISDESFRCIKAHAQKNPKKK